MGEETQVSATENVAAVAAMRRAIALAELGLGSTSPNPIVGCVIVGPDGSVVGEGYHARAGEPHAEVVALRDAGGRSFGATAFVTLEPCRHTGRTPPCTRALIDAGVARVVFAVADPNAVAGHGADDLRAAGVLVEEGLLGDEAARSNAAWLHHARTGRPFVTWKYAATLDGRVAATDGTSRWITGEAARHDVHLLRARSDAIVVGTGTVLADDPRLDVRLPDAPSANRPLRVVVGHRDVPPASKVLDDAAPTVLLDEHDPKAVLAYLSERGVVGVLLEGGPTLAGAFVAAGMVDRVVAYVAPALLGAGPAALGDAGIETLGSALRLHIDAVDLIGDDVRIIATPKRWE
jgi:diaminohydroxyphosphoribosylaminopyrimidine deaminase/5-amino-6-(5-phosphoribosylamino)uracil reductase